MCNLVQYIIIYNETVIVAQTIVKVEHSPLHASTPTANPLSAEPADPVIPVKIQAATPVVVTSGGDLQFNGSTSSPMTVATPSQLQPVVVTATHVQPPPPSIPVSIRYLFKGRRNLNFYFLGKFFLY